MVAALFVTTRPVRVKSKCPRTRRTSSPVSSRGRRGRGHIAGTGQTTVKKYLEKHTTAIATGFGLAVVFYLWFEVCFG